MARVSYLEGMSYESLQNLRKYHPAWKLLAAGRAPLVVSFLHEAFVAENNREIPEYQLAALLRERLEALEREDVDAKAMLTEWADDSCGWLRKFYPAGSDEVHYDLTSAAQKAIEWVVGLNVQGFIGTESRIMMVFQLFHDIIEQSDEDPIRRVRELERRKAEIEAEIAKVELGQIRVLEPVQIKERYQQAMQLSREILADFRAVEQNFRELQQSMQSKIVSWDRGKGELLGDYFHNQEGIEQSEQGRSFQAFFDFLMSKAAQDDFEQTIQAVSALDAVKELPSSKTAFRIIRDWVDGSKHVQDMLAAVSEQLRRYVDENFLQEERRINQIIKNIEATAITLQGEVPKGEFMQIDGVAPEILLPFDRPLFSPPVSNPINQQELLYGSAEEGDDSALYTHISVNKTLLSGQIDALLQESTEVSLAQVIAAYPIRLGLAELIGYLSIAQDSPSAMLQPQLHEPLLWQDADGAVHRADFCRILYRRSTKG